jgi:hypothetical protein
MVLFAAKYHFDSQLRHWRMLLKLEVSSLCLSKSIPHMLVRSQMKWVCWIHVAFVELAGRSPSPQSWLER